MNDTLTIPEAAALLDMRPAAVRLLCRRARLPGAVNSNPERPGRGEWRIPRAAVEAYAAGRSVGRGRPRTRV